MEISFSCERDDASFEWASDRFKFSGNIGHLSRKYNGFGGDGFEKGGCWQSSGVREENLGRSPKGNTLSRWIG